MLDKPVGMTSTQAVGAVRRIFNAQKAGHAGTLDPLATGVLPIALGEATKTVPFAVDGEKRYRFTVRWGAGTDTDDAEGRITASSELRPSREAVEALLPRFTGEILQTPPAFSAIKVDGNRAYDLARAGEVVELEARSAQVDRLTLVAMPDGDTAVFEAECGKGTYVRALARDMGRALGCLGHVIALRRTRVAPFDEAQAVTLEALREPPPGRARTRCTAAASHRGGPAGPCRDQRRPERCRAPLARPGRADPRPRCADRHRPHLCNLQGPADRGWSDRERRAAPGARVQFLQRRLTVRNGLYLRVNFSLAIPANWCITPATSQEA